MPDSVADPLGYYLANTVKTRALIETALGASADVAAAASAWNGHLVVRFLGRDPDALRAAAIRVLVGYRGVPMPRVWQT